MLEPCQGYSRHGSLKDTAIFSPALVLFSYFSFLAHSQSSLAPLTLWSDYVPFAVGYQDPLGPQEQKGGPCMDKWQRPSRNRDTRRAWPQHLKNGVVIHLRASGLQVKQNRRLNGKTALRRLLSSWNPSHHGLWPPQSIPVWGMAAHPNPFLIIAKCFAPGSAGVPEPSGLVSAKCN